jgi:hypothetical protein
MPVWAKKSSRLSLRMHGTSLAELPVGLWVIFVGIGMPLLCLTLTTVRFGLFLEAARQAADVAAQAQTYVNSVAPDGTSNLGSVVLAQNQAVTVASSFSGLSINPDDVKCWIVITPIATTGSSSSAAFGPNTPLSTPPDPTQNLYQLRVDISGQIQPIVSMAMDGLISIPGLNAPMTVSASMTRVFENPPGLYVPNSSG